MCGKNMLTMVASLMAPRRVSRNQMLFGATQSEKGLRLHFSFIQMLLSRLMVVNRRATN